MVHVQDARQRYATRYICEHGHVYYQRGNQVMLVDKLERAPEWAK